MYNKSKIISDRELIDQEDETDEEIPKISYSKANPKLSDQRKPHARHD